MNCKQKPIDEMNELLGSVSQAILSTLDKDISREGDMTFSNYEQNLAELEEIINKQFLKDEKAEKIDEKLKEDVTKYSKGLPAITYEEVRDKNEEGLLQEGRFRDYASDFWEKKKQVKN